MTLQRMGNVGIVVDDLAAAIAFFVELGLELEGEMQGEESWSAISGGNQRLGPEKSTGPTRSLHTGSVRNRCPSSRRFPPSIVR
jgi:catechol 2,3-dioxygenase-like lactoylglutathione lyase family enzyme